MRVNVRCSSVLRLDDHEGDHIIATRIVSPEP
jgi:hypothetical protein